MPNYGQLIGTVAGVASTAFKAASPVGRVATTISTGMTVYEAVSGGDVPQGDRVRAALRLGRAVGLSGQDRKTLVRAMEAGLSAKEWASAVYEQLHGAGDGYPGGLVGMLEDYLDVHAPTDEVSPFPAAVGGLQAAIAGVGSSSDIAAAVWSVLLAPGESESVASNALYRAFTMAQAMENVSLWRCWDAPHFLLQGVQRAHLITGLGLDLKDVSPAARGEDETDLAMCERLHPELDWEDDFGGSGLVAFTTPVELGSVITGYYVPAVPSDDVLARLKALWRYQPYDGGEWRDGIPDTVRLLSLVPVHW